MAKIASICVYCGSQTGHDETYAATAKRFGEAVAKRGITLVYGAGGIGLMTVVADAALANGGKVIGVIPKHLARIEVKHGGLTETVVTDSMHVRKQAMFDRADAFVVLPGGFGTLDEFFEILTWKQIGLHDKPLVVLDGDGYWKPLHRLLDHVISQGFASKGARDLFSVAKSIDELFRTLDRAPEPEPPAPSDRL
jgi:uncharacterized protein (TIGR00730 family)